MRERERERERAVASLCLSSSYPVAVVVLWLFLAVPWVGLQCGIVVFPDHTHLLYLFRVIMEANTVNSDKTATKHNQS